MASNQHPLTLLLVFVTHLLLCLELCVENTFSASTKTEVEALLTWKHSLADSSGLLSWTDSDSADACGWIGILCDEPTSSISVIDASNSDLQGTLDQFNFSAFPNLAWLHLHDNSLNGSIPSDIGQSKKLHSLVLESNKFSGKIPDELGLLDSLEILSLSRNHLVGSIPESISQLTRLQTLDLSDNHLTGVIPRLYCTNLHDFNMSHNYFFGSIPSELSTFGGLTVIDLSYNNLTGEVPGGNLPRGNYTGNPGICSNSIQGLQQQQHRPIFPVVTGYGGSRCQHPCPETNQEGGTERPDS